MNQLSEESRRFHRDELRKARAQVLADAEAYAAPLHAIERLGRHLDVTARSLWDASPSLRELAAASPLSHQLSKRWRAFHPPFPELLDTVRGYRNDVMHVGARARHLTTHAVEACLILEDALHAGLSTVGDFMVRNPITVEPWQPVSLVRRQMLEHSFTFIPLAPENEEGDWRLIADHHIARFLGNRADRMDRLAMRIGDALADGLETAPAEPLDAAQPISKVREAFGHHPRLVVSQGRVVGIITAFDML